MEALSALMMKTDPSNGVPTRQLGPINSWWISGFDGGPIALTAFTTAYAEYILMEASTAYRPIMATVQAKIYLSKVGTRSSALCSYRMVISR